MDIERLIHIDPRVRGNRYKTRLACIDDRLRGAGCAGRQRRANDAATERVMRSAKTVRQPVWRFVALLLGAAALPACQDSQQAGPPQHDPAVSPEAREVRIPEPSEWTDEGVAVAAGPEEAWDQRLSGALSPATVIKHGDMILLYYIGADGDREAAPGDDGGPRHRALGVASSQDGINFTKYGGNPVITFRPTPEGINAQEEGVFSAAALSDGEQITLYFGGMTMTDGTTVRIDIYRTTSADGFTFEEPIEVLDGTAPDVWGNDGAGDEIFPAGVIRHGDTWNLYYLTKNRDPGLMAQLNGDAGGSWDYGMVSGAQGDRLGDSREVLLQKDSTLGGEYRHLSPIPVSPDTYALFLINFDPEESMTNLELRMANATQPDSLSDPEVAYTFQGKVYATVFLDEPAGRWLMYSRREEEPDAPIRVMSAPVDYVQP